MLCFNKQNNFIIINILTTTENSKIFTEINFVVTSQRKCVGIVLSKVALLQVRIIHCALAFKQNLVFEKSGISRNKTKSDKLIFILEDDRLILYPFCRM